MLDYYGSIMKDQSSIYSEITDRFSEYKSSYIKGILDEMYSYYRSRKWPNIILP